MAHDIYTERDVPSYGADPAMLVLIVALLGVVFWFGAQSTETATRSQSTIAAPQAEDWHGNVKRSTWPN